MSKKNLNIFNNKSFTIIYYCFHDAHMASSVESFFLAYCRSPSMKEDLMADTHDDDVDS